MRLDYYLFFKKPNYFDLIRKVINSRWVITAWIAWLLFAVTQPACAAPSSPDITKVKITLELKNETLLVAFDKIEAQTSFHFTYRKEDVKDIQNISMTNGKRSVAEFLTKLFSNTSLSFEQVDQRILITRKMEAATHFISASVQPASFQLENSHAKIDKVITGQVTNANGDVLNGVSITVKGNSAGTSTDEQGRYRISTPDNGTLVFTFIGYMKQGKSTYKINRQ